MHLYIFPEGKHLKVAGHRRFLVRSLVPRSTFVRPAICVPPGEFGGEWGNHSAHTDKNLAQSRCRTYAGGSSARITHGSEGTFSRKSIRFSFFSGESRPEFERKCVLRLVEIRQDKQVCCPLTACVRYKATSRTHFVYTNFMNNLTRIAREDLLNELMRHTVLVYGLSDLIYYILWNFLLSYECI